MVHIYLGAIDFLTSAVLCLLISKIYSLRGKFTYQFPFLNIQKNCYKSYYTCALNLDEAGKF